LLRRIAAAELGEASERCEGKRRGDGRSAIDSGFWRAEELGVAQAKRAGIRPGFNEYDSEGGYGTSSLEAWALARAAEPLLGIGKESECGIRIRIRGFLQLLQPIVFQLLTGLVNAGNTYCLVRQLRNRNSLPGQRIFRGAN
jgi:hypothetical protein